MTWVLDAYRGLTTALDPFAGLILQQRARAGREDPLRLTERLGHASRPRPDGPLVWLHGVSVGESLSALPVIAALRRARPDVALLVTSGTLTSATLLARRISDGVIHQFAPVDTPAATARFLDHWRPDLGLLIESELWPNLILGARARGTRLGLISARITEKTARGWARVPQTARTVLSAFDLVAPQDEASQARLEALGVRCDLKVNLKLAGEALPHDPAAFDSLSAAIGDRAVVLAASTHAGEEALIAQAAPREALLILVPRHPDRADTIEADLAAQGLTVARRSRHDPIAPDLDVYLADTLGELGLFLRLAEVVVLGGGFTGGVGGHNPLEAARLGRAVIAGTDTANWAEVFDQLSVNDAVVMVRPEGLKAALAATLTDPAAWRERGARAERLALGLDSGLEALMSRIVERIPR